MTQAEALQEARKRWGMNGQAWRKNRRSSPKNLIHGTTRYFVSGFARADIGDRKYGSGESWESAFADADRREKGGPA